ncbi:TetR/AcrR family transcriptional regulator [Streptomyces plumbiresistens]|uniref:TetR/AcrR family transcriptional regulator n=1 Tax=Streptomyces plumbiresistens TaxID=511811 RepID=A0ABP7TER1_9ACTN
MTIPARGTRPANRRQLILSAATELFHDRGYANVRMSDIAEAVAVGPSALYRHFQSKQKLLEAVVEDSLEDSARVLREMPHGRTAMARSLASNAIGRRHAGVLWRREARQIPEVDSALRPRAREFIRSIAGMLAESRPDLGPVERTLLAHCVVGAANSVSFHSLRLPEARFIDVLAGILEVVIACPIPRLVPRPPPRDAPALRSVSTREALLEAAGELFARHGYGNVAMEQIATHAGVAGTSVYGCFPRKSDALEAALTRTAEWLRIDMNRVLASADGPAEALERLLRCYAAFVLDHPDTVRLALTEAVNLEEPARTRFRESQIDYFADWAELLTQIKPDVPNIEIRLRVHAVVAVMNEVAVTSYPRRFADILSTVVAMGSTVLGLGEGWTTEVNGCTLQK